MASFNAFIKLAKYHQNLNSPIDFITIYIREAHPSDGLKFVGSEYSFISNHQHLEDRINAVKTLIEMAKIEKEDRISFYCDTMNDHTNNLFRASPERLYVLYDEKIFYQGGMGPQRYSISSLEFLLRKLI